MGWVDSQLKSRTAQDSFVCLFVVSFFLKLYLYKPLFYSPSFHPIPAKYPFGLQLLERREVQMWGQILAGEVGGARQWTMEAAGSPCGWSPWKGIYWWSWSFYVP